MNGKIYGGLYFNIFINVNFLFSLSKCHLLWGKRGGVRSISGSGKEKYTNENRAASFYILNSIVTFYSQDIWNKEQKDII